MCLITEGEPPTLWYAVFRFFRWYTVRKELVRSTQKILVYLTQTPAFTLKKCNFHQRTQQMWQHVKRTLNFSHTCAYFEHVNI